MLVFPVSRRFRKLILNASIRCHEKESRRLVVASKSSGNVWSCPISFLINKRLPHNKNDQINMILALIWDNNLWVYQNGALTLLIWVRDQKINKNFFFLLDENLVLFFSFFLGEQIQSASSQCLLHTYWMCLLGFQTRFRVENKD